MPSCLVAYSDLVLCVSEEVAGMYLGQHCLTRPRFVVGHDNLDDDHNHPDPDDDSSDDDDAE